MFQQIDEGLDNWKDCAISFSRKCYTTDFQAVTSFTVNRGVCVLFGKCEVMWWCDVEWVIIFHSSPVCFHLPRICSDLSPVFFRSVFQSLSLVWSLWFICLNHPEEQRRGAETKEGFSTIVLPSQENKLDVNHVLSASFASCLSTSLPVPERLSLLFIILSSSDGALQYFMMAPNSLSHGVMCHCDRKKALKIH